MKELFDVICEDIFSKDINISEALKVKKDSQVDLGNDFAKTIFYCTTGYETVKEAEDSGFTFANKLFKDIDKFVGMINTDNEDFLRFSVYIDQHECKNVDSNMPANIRNYMYHKYGKTNKDFLVEFKDISQFNALWNIIQKQYNDEQTYEAYYGGFDIYYNAHYIYISNSKLWGIIVTPVWQL